MQRKTIVSKEPPNIRTNIGSGTILKIRMGTRLNTIMLTMVAFTEKVISVSFCDPGSLLQQLFVFEEKEKKVNTGKRSREGWFKKVFNMARCLMNTRPVTRPGKVNRKNDAENGKTFQKKTNANALPTSVRKQAMTRRMNLTVRRPSRGPLSGRILQTPIFKDFAIPRLAVTSDVQMAKTNMYPPFVRRTLVWLLVTAPALRLVPWKDK